ncbi:hypothetical protein [Brevundimonas sp.]|uniref:hypothetical protein n=1 Tax=Brevundimonas sp. TaxID=1871086 RepID=UPI0025BDD637|nr:hypothetical protein [Brevundimonas sp.]
MYEGEVRSCHVDRRPIVSDEDQKAEPWFQKIGASPGQLLEAVGENPDDVERYLAHGRMPLRELATGPSAPVWWEPIEQSRGQGLGQRHPGRTLGRASRESLSRVFDRRMVEAWVDVTTEGGK